MSEIADQQAPEDWTAPEKKLWAAFLDGTNLDLGGPDPVRSPLSADSYGSERSIRASIIAHLLLDGPKQPPGKPPRLVLKGARIIGRLDVGCASLLSFHFTDCAFDEPPFLNDAIATFIGFSHCTLPGMEARRLKCSGPLWLGGSRVRGQIGMDNSEIAGDLILGGSEVSNPNGPAIDINGTRIAGNLVMDSISVSGHLLMHAARIDGDVLLSGAKLSDPNGFALRGSQMQVGASFSAFQGLDISGGVNLEGAQVEGKLLLIHATISHPLKNALILDHARIGLGLDCGNSRIQGSIRLHHSVIGCQVSLKGVKVSDAPKMAIRADHMKVEGSVFLGGLETQNTVDLHGAQIECNLSLRRGSLRSSAEGAALNADRAWVGGTMQDAVVGYGYAPIRAFSIFMLLFVGAAFWFSVGAVDCNSSTAGLCPVKADEHPTWDPWLYSLDLLIPLIDLGHEQAWDPIGISKIVMIVLVVSGWVLTTTIIAAASRTLRRS
ncbi:hypothetical protein [Nonomuraea harbinensis]|uniref:Oxidoreductase n=1 Tax=Nonomuraea harbinensis TaxID=1286938 RepID=A0ABW1CC63_9ACTN|nr:hypothetical protein [Nonomuraea harbinensis]